MSGRGNKGRGRHSPSPSDSSDDDTFTHIQCWIPAANIDLVVLATYLKEFVDDTATIKPAASPQNPSKPGYQVGARNTLSVPAVQDIIQDSRTWEKEKTSRDYKREPYSFNESDTWYSRKKKGASPGATKPRQRRRRPEEAADPPATTTDTSRTSRPAQTQTTNTSRHARDPRPESPPRPSNPPPDILKERERGSKIPQPGFESQFRKMSIADAKDTSREDLSKKKAYDDTKEEANRGARIQPNTSSTRHRDKMEDDIRSTTSGRRERERTDLDDDIRSVASGRARERHR